MQILRPIAMKAGEKIAKELAKKSSKKTIKKQAKDKRTDIFGRNKAERKAHNKKISKIVTDTRQYAADRKLEKAVTNNIPNGSRRDERKRVYKVLRSAGLSDSGRDFSSRLNRIDARCSMKFLKRLGIVAAVYIVFVVLFETVFLGLLQPKLENLPYQMLVLTTTDGSGDSQSRRLASFETDKKLYVSAHHWPRGWYKRTLKNPNVQVEINSMTSDYVAVPVEDEEL